MEGGGKEASRLDIIDYVLLYATSEPTHSPRVGGNLLIESGCTA